MDTLSVDRGVACAGRLRREAHWCLALVPRRPRRRPRQPPPLHPASFVGGPPVRSSGGRPTPVPAWRCVGLRRRDSGDRADAPVWPRDRPRAPR